ncbi:g13489 [Coccomyxa viridis]|uniref:G13489 protein n=1 Tax=Coccomyxa viridis TaxID=1274662 RepID=A0ABP1GH86_9CHLO
MARGTFSRSSYVTAVGPTASSMDKSSSGVTFGRDEAAASSKRQPCLRVMARVRFPPREQRNGAAGEGGDRPCSSVDVKACIICGITETPLWRANHLDGEKNLCNACGVRQNRLKRARRAGDASPHSVCSIGQIYKRTETSSLLPGATKRAASAGIDKLPSMMSDASPISRAWSLGQLEDDLTKGWDPYLDPQECHSDPIDFCSTRGAATASLEDTAVRGEGLQLSSSRQVDPDLDSDLDPLDPRFLARIHDPHPK